MSDDDPQIIDALLEWQPDDQPLVLPPICPVCDQPVADGPAYVDSDGVHHALCYRRHVVGGHAVTIDS